MRGPTVVLAASHLFMEIKRLPAGLSEPSWRVHRDCFITPNFLEPARNTGESWLLSRRWFSSIFISCNCHGDWLAPCLKQGGINEEWNALCQWMNLPVLPVLIRMQFQWNLWRRAAKGAAKNRHRQPVRIWIEMPITGTIGWSHMVSRESAEASKHTAQKKWATTLSSKKPPF